MTNNNKKLVIDDKELKFMDSTIRKLIQKYYEFRIFNKFLKKNKVNLRNKVILDIGCGSGFGCQLINKKFKPQELHGFDFLPEQVDKALRRRVPNASFKVGDVADIEFPDNKFDAVVVFAILHHVPEWRKGLEEIHRVLKPNGVFLVEEPNKKLIELSEERWPHPQESRFTWPEFTGALQNTGFQIVEDRSLFFTEDFKAFMCQKR